MRESNRNVLKLIRITIFTRFTKFDGPRGSFESENRIFNARSVIYVCISCVVGVPMLFKRIIMIRLLNPMIKNVNSCNCR